jgi:hypothetical protein
LFDTMRQCAGYPTGHHCMVIIPKSKPFDLCHGCMRNLEEVQRREWEAANGRKTCGCGGLPDEPYHTQTLMHIEWAYKTARRRATH